MIYYIILISMTLMGAVAALFLKRATEGENLKKILLNYNFYMGAGLYLMAAVLNIYVLHYMDYSVVLPLTSMTYVWTMIFSYAILKENMTNKKFIGVLLVVFGALFVTF